MTSAAEADIRVTESCPRGLSAPNNYSHAERDDSVPGLVPPGLVSATFGTAAGSFWTSPASAPGPAGEPSSASWKYPGDYHSCPGERWDQQYARAVAETSDAKAREDANVWLVDPTGPSLKSVKETVH